MRQVTSVTLHLGKPGDRPGTFPDAQQLRFKCEQRLLGVLEIPRRRNSRVTSDLVLRNPYGRRWSRRRRYTLRPQKGRKSFVVNILTFKPLGGQDFADHFCRTRATQGFQWRGRGIPFPPEIFRNETRLNPVCERPTAMHFFGYFSTD